MKIVIAVLLLSIVLLSNSTLVAQTDADKARIRMHILNAESALQNSNWDIVLDNTKKAEEILGGKAAIFESFRIKAYQGKKEYQKAKKHLDTFFELNPADNLITEIAPILEIINKELEKEKRKIEAEERRIEAEKRRIEAEKRKAITEREKGAKYFEEGQFNQAKAAFETVLSIIPDDSYAKTMLHRTKDNIAWEQAKRINNIRGYYSYIDNFSNGIYANIANEIIDNLDKNAYEKAIRIGTQQELNYYLSNYSKGKYRNDIYKRLNERIEYDEYRHVIEKDDINLYEKYIKKYPVGKYASEVNSRIGRHYYELGNKAYNYKQYLNAKNYYDTYINRFPNGSYSSEVRNLIAQCQRKLNQMSCDFLLYSYNQQSPIGLSIGRLNKDKLGYYLNIKGNLNRYLSEGTNSTATIDNKGNSNAPNYVALTGKTTHLNIALSGGVTFNVAYPLWVYAGLGVGYFTQYDEVDQYDRSGNFDNTMWMMNTEETKIIPFPEVGVKLQIPYLLVLKYGMMYNRGIIHQIGIGIPTASFK